MSDWEIFFLCLGWATTCALCFVLGYKTAKIENEEDE